MRRALGWVLRGALLGALAFLVFGPLANLALWAVAIRWYYPYKLPVTWGFKYWGEVFKPTSDAFAALGTSLLIASITVVVCLLLAIPAGYALGRARLPGHRLVLLILLLPQAFPNLAVYFNIARLFYTVGLNGTIAGVVLVHAERAGDRSVDRRGSLCVRRSRARTRGAQPRRLGSAHGIYRDPTAGDARPDGECDLCLS